jgi:hypothetical protein
MNSVQHYASCRGTQRIPCAARGIVTKREATVGKHVVAGANNANIL